MLHARPLAILFSIFMAWTAIASTPIPLTSFTADSDASSEPNNFFEWQGAWYFSAISNFQGRELWTANLDGSNARVLCDISAGSASSSPRLFTPFRGELWFVADDVENTALLCKINTQGECSVIKRFQGESNYTTALHALTTDSKHLYFTVNFSSIDDSTSQYWRTTVAGDEVERIVRPTDSYYSNPAYSLIRMRSGSEDATLALTVSDEGSVAIVSLPDDRSAHTTIQTFALPQAASYQFDLLSRVGHICYASVLPRPPPQGQTSSPHVFARFNLVTGTVDMNDYPAHDNDGVGWDSMSISPTGEIYYVSYDRKALMRLTQTGPPEVVDYYFDSTIAGIYATRDSVFMLKSSLNRDTWPPTSLWKIFQVSNPNDSNAKLALLHQGTIPSGDKFPFSFTATIAASSNGKNLAFSQPITQRGTEAGFISANGTTREVNLNNSSSQTIGNAHMLNDGTFGFTTQLTNGFVRLWSSNSQYADAREFLLASDLQSTDLLAVHPLASGQLLVTGKAVAPRYWYRDPSGTRAITFDVPGFRGFNYQSTRVMFAQGDFAVFSIVGGSDCTTLWAFDARTASLFSLNEHLRIPECTDIKWSHNTQHFGYFSTEQPIEDGSASIIKYFKSNGTLKGSKSVPSFQEFVVGTGNATVFIENDKLIAKDEKSGRSNTLLKSSESMDFRGLVAQEVLDQGRHFFVSLNSPNNYEHSNFLIQSNGTAKGTRRLNQSWSLRNCKTSQRWLVQQYADSLLFLHQDEEESVLVSSTADGHAFLKIHQSLVDDVAIYFTATTREHGDAIFVSYGTPESTFLMLPLASSSPESALLYCSAKHLYFKQANAKATTQVYVLPLIGRRVVQRGIIPQKESQTPTFTQPDQKITLQIVRPPEDKSKGLKWRILGADDKTFRAGKLQNFPSKNQALYNELSLTLVSHFFSTVQGQIEFYNEGDGAPFARVLLVAKRSIPPSNYSINGYSNPDEFASQSIVGAWGWTMTLQPDSEIRRILKRVDFFLNGTLRSSGTEMSHVFETGVAYENQLRAIGYNAEGQVVLDQTHIMHKSPQEKVLPMGAHRYQGYLQSFLDYSRLAIGEISLNERTDGSYSIEMLYQGDVKRGKGKFDERGLSTVMVKGKGPALSIGLEKLMNDQEPMLNCYITDGKFGNGIFSGHTFSVRASILANTRAAAGNLHARPGRYHMLLAQDETNQSVCSLELDSNGSAQIKGTLLSGKRFTRSTWLPVEWKQGIYLADLNPQKSTLLTFSISEMTDTDNSVYATVTKKPTKSDPSNYYQIEGIVDRYDAETDGLAWRTEHAPESMRLNLGPYKKAASQFSIIARDANHSTWAEYTDWLNMRININHQTGSAEFKNRSILGDALYFRSQNKFLGTMQAGKAGQIFSLESN